MVLVIIWENLFNAVFIDVKYLMVCIYLLRYIGFKINYFFLFYLVLVYHSGHVLFGFFLNCITIRQNLPVSSVLKTLGSILLLDSPVNNESSSLQLLYPPHKVFILKMTPRYRILIRSVRNLWVVLSVSCFVVKINVFFFTVNPLVKAIITGLN